MDMKKRLLACGLVLAMTVSALSGCGKDNGSSSSSGQSSSSAPAAIDLSTVKDPYLTTSGLAGDAVVAKVGEVEVTAAELLYWINYGIELSLAQYGGKMVELPWDADLGGMTMADQMKQSALNAAAFYALIPTIAQQEGLSVNQETMDELNRQREQAIATLGSEEVAEHSFWHQMITWDLLSELSQRGDLHLQLQELYFGEGSENYPTDAEVLAYAQDELGVYRAKHILISTRDENDQPLDDAAIAEKKAKADDLIAQIRAADDPIAMFDTLMHEHSEDPGLITAPEGYTTQKGQMVPQFEDTALSLKDGEISDPVESQFGYHIILRLPISPDNYRSQLVAQLMQTKTDQWLEEYGVQTTENYDKIDVAQFNNKVRSMQLSIQNEINAVLQAQQEGSGAGSSDSSSAPASSQPDGSGAASADSASAPASSQPEG